MAPPQKLIPAILKRELCYIIHQIDWRPPSYAELEHIVQVEIVHDVHADRELLRISFLDLSREWLPGIPCQTYVTFHLEQDELGRSLDYLTEKYLRKLAWEVCIPRFPKEVLNYWSA